MPSWGFGPEKNNSNDSSNATAGIKAGNQAFVHDQKKEKRNVIATNKGWVRREHRLMNGGTASSVTRQIDEVLVAAGNKDGAPSSNLGFPDIAQIYFANSTNDDVTSITPETGGGGAEHQVRVVFNEPIKYNEAAGSKVGKVVLSRVTGSGNSTITATASSVARTNTNITGANNTMIFRFTPTSGDAGTYKVAAATAGIANGVSGTLTIKSLNSSEAANVTITGAVSNAAILTITAHS
tara:strand:- start:1713 stop:2426 length:714 start_codon:yes stop_codon:yes gene_type:complete